MTALNNRQPGKPVLRRVPVAMMEVNPRAQRELNPGWVRRLAAGLEPELMGNPVVSRRDGVHYIVDGQHRVAAYKEWAGGEGAWENLQLECWVYEGLTDRAESDLFLLLNNRLKPNSFDEFRVAAQAGRERETEICRIVEDLGLEVSRNRPGIRAVGVLRRVYDRGGPEVLARTLLIIRDAYGTDGFEGPVIDGVGLFCQRYSGQIRDDVVIGKLRAGLGGSAGLVNSANHLRKMVGQQKAQCVAAAVVDQVNRGKGGKKLPGWWQP